MKNKLMILNIIKIVKSDQEFGNAIEPEEKLKKTDSQFRFSYIC